MSFFSLLLLFELHVFILLCCWRHTLAAPVIIAFIPDLWIAQPALNIYSIQQTLIFMMARLITAGVCIHELRVFPQHDTRIGLYTSYCMSSSARGASGLQVA
jgi:hypothetical protein